MTPREYLPPAFDQLAGGCLTPIPKFFPGSSGIKLPHVIPTVAFISNESLSLLIGIVCMFLIGRISYLWINDHLSPRNPEISFSYSETINQKIRELPIKAPARIAHIGDGYCSLLGADNINRPGKIMRFLYRIFGMEEPHSHLDGLYDVVVVQDNIRKKYLWRHLKENGYLIVVEWPDRAGKTEILNVVRVKDYYEKPSILDAKTFLMIIIFSLSIYSNADAVIQAGGLFGIYANMRRVLSQEEMNKHEEEVFKSNVDGYMDAVRLIIKDIFNTKVRPELHQRLMDIGRSAIVEALKNWDGDVSTRDAYIYESIRSKIVKDLRRSA